MSSQQQRSISGYRAAVTRQINNCKASVDGQNVSYLNVKNDLDTLIDRWNKYENKFENFLISKQDDLDDADYKTLEDRHAEFEISYNENLRNFRTKLEELESARSTNYNSNNQNTNTVRVRMPEIKLSEFSGVLEDWVPFWDRFSSLVHNRTDLDNVCKMTYLVSCLKGQALELIKGYQSSEEDYRDAVNTLIDRYADKNKIKQSLVLQLFNLKPVSNNPTALENFKNSYERILKTLKHYQDDIKQSYWLIAILLQSKLPMEADLFIYTKCKNKYFSVKEISDGLIDHIDYLTKLKFHAPVNKPKESVFKSQNFSQPELQVKELGHIGSYNVKINHNSCLLCSQEGHRAKNCTKFVTFESRRDKLLSLKKCVKCLKTHTGKCLSNVTCNFCNKLGHNEIFCFKLLKVKTDKVELKTNTVMTNSVNIEKVKISSALAISKVKVSAKNKFSISARVIIDIGSQISFITSKLANKLKLKKVNEMKLTIKGFNSPPQERIYSIVKPTVTLGNRRKVISAAISDDIPINVNMPGITKVQEFLLKNNIKLADKFEADNVNDIDLLLGSEFFASFVNSLKKFEDIDLLNTTGGNVIYGKIPSRYLPNNTCNSEVSDLIVCRITSNHSFQSLPELIEEDEPIHKLWELDTIGINPNAVIKEDITAYKNYVDSVEFREGQYFVRLPWKLDKPFLFNNYRKSLGQLYSLRNNLLKKDNLLNFYDSVIKEQYKNKFIEIVKNPKVTDYTHYIPHHGVLKNSPTTPLRIVHNCSAKAINGISLNSCLMKGPSLTEKLGDVLLKFRINKFAYTSDISKAFMRVGLQDCDRDWLRFLWFEDPHDENSKLVTYRFCSVLFGSTSSPFLLNATLDYHFKHSKSPLKEVLAKSFYVDNMLGVTNDENKLFQIYYEANTEMDKAGLPLRMWASNNDNLNLQIERDFDNYKVPTEINILGLTWNQKNDVISLKFVKFDKLLNVSKRRLLSLVSSVFDPLGLYTPITIRGRILIQRAWKIKSAWNDNLPIEYVDKWNELVDDLVCLSSFKYNRSVTFQSSCELHLFCDSSLYAYGVVAYIVDGTGSRLLLSKSRVTPLKSKTLPQLELTSLWLAFKVANYIVSVLKDINFEVFIWTDSEICLQWINSGESNITYVRNRISDIKEMQNNFSVFHVRSQCNPSDILTRGLGFEEFKNSKLWHNGPTWLINKDLWPPQKTFITVNKVSVESDKTIEILKLFDIENISSLNKIINITSYVFEFLNSFKTLKNIRPLFRLPEASKYWIIMSQVEFYPEIYNCLHSGNSNIEITFVRAFLSRENNLNHESKKMILDLGLYCDNNSLIRCGGRIANSKFNYHTKHPILLSPKSYLSRLLVAMYHKYGLHSGVQSTLASFRQMFWLPRGRQIIKSIIFNCVTCKKIEGKPIRYPGPPELPVSRVVLEEPFSSVGVDYTGPMLITNMKNENLKVYIVLFTCTATRGVFLDVAEDMTASTFLLIFRRFCATFSTPQLVISDNGSYFKASADYFDKMLNDPVISKFSNINQIKWKFISPRAAWQGGFYERMIKLVKSCLRKTLYKRKINLNQLRTLIVEIQNELNNRPITYVSSIKEEFEPLTPSHLIFGRRINRFPSLFDHNLNDPLYADHDILNEKFSLISTLSNKFKKIWRVDYLLSLRERHYGADSATNLYNLRIGDIVLVECDSPRGEWPLGKIEQLLPDQNGIVRSVKVKCKGVVSVRTVNRLVPLEINNSEFSQNCELEVDKTDTGSDQSIGTHSGTRPKRRAGVEAANIRKLLIDNNQL